MINKQSLWFVTLFSLIIVLGIYYFSSDETNIGQIKSSTTSSYVAKNIGGNNISVLKVTDSESTMGRINELEDILLDEKASLEEKNNAYDELQVIGNKKTKEEELTNLINKTYNVDSFVKINDNQIAVVINKSEHNYTDANNIIKLVQEKFTDNKYITIKYDE